MPPPSNGAQPPGLPPLVEGERLDRKTFHARYEAMPEDVKAELIGGVVYTASPLKRPHSRGTRHLLHWLATYEDATPGTETHNNATTILDDDNEPQPDLSLLVVAPGHGQTRDQDGYVVGPPELAVEVSDASQSVDLGPKRAAYERLGVCEYLVVVVRHQRVVWHALRGGQYQELQPGPDGVLRSGVFPGLWLDPAALLADNGPAVLAVLAQGLASPEHAAFVARLAAPPQP
jgi:Uma2 family endonuclease